MKRMAGRETMRDDEVRGGRQSTGAPTRASDSPIPAATIVVMRERGEGPPELLMLERAASLAFAGGALVFPGGRVDPADREWAAELPGDRDENAARLAAVRETLEEAGLAIGLAVPDEAVAAMRAWLLEGQTLAEAVARAGARVALDMLEPFARWLPYGLPSRVFDTRFYLARAPEGATATADGGENVRLFWARASALLAEADAGRVTLIYPTRRNVERLATLPSYDAAVAHARAHPIETITPWIEQRAGADHLCIPEGLGYPVTSEPFAVARRG